MRFFRRRSPRPEPPVQPESQAGAQLQPVQPDGAPPIRRIDNLADLDAELQEVERAFQVSDDEGRRRLTQFEYVLPRAFPPDPYSPEYAAAQMQIYTALSGRSAYPAAVDERSPFDLELAKRRPFPYVTGSAATVDEQLILQGFLIRSMNLPAGSRIVEFGPGWGNTTLHLAQMGYRVTAVEIEPSFVELIRHRAATLGVEIDLVNQDMLEFQPRDRFDAALFFECFHHCADHLRLLRNLDAMIEPDGLVAFASEPIADFPHPWGFVRTEGQTLWSIRRYGWFELGFDSSYFLRTLLRFGWLPYRQRSDVAPLADVIVARKSNGRYAPGEITLPPDEAASWSGPERGHRFTGARSVMSCALQPPEAVELCLSNPAPFDLDVSLTAGRSARRLTLGRHAAQELVRLPAEGWDGRVTIESSTWNPGQVFRSTDDRMVGVAVHWCDLLGHR